EAAQLSGSKVLQMRKALEEAASNRFHAADTAASEREAAGEFDEARRILRELRDEAQAVAGIPEKVDARLVRVDEAHHRAVASRDAPDPRREAESRFRPLEDSIRALEANREYERAIGILEGARTMAEDNAVLVAMIVERIGMLRALASKAVVKPPPPTPKESPDLILQRALAEFNAGQIDRAIPILAQMFRDAPNDSRGHALAAHCVLRKGNKMSASGYATRALQLNPADPRANLVIGLIRAEEGKFEEAIARLDTALAAEPGWTEGRLARARACVGLKKWDLALKDLEQLPDAPATLKIDSLEGIGRLPEAAEACGAWTQQPASLLRRAGIYLKLKENDKARADFEKALEVDPANEEAKAALAKLRPAVKPPEVKKPLKPSDIKKKLAEYFNAKSENFVIRRDDKVLAQLWYDWSKAEQLQDFATEAVSHDKRQLVLQGAANKVGGLSIRARLSGEWSVRLDVVLTGAVGQTSGWGVRTANSLLPSPAPGEYAGAGVYQDPGGWKLVTATVGRKDAPPPQSKPVTLQPGSMVTLVLTREGSKFRATYGSGIVCELEADGMDPSYLRVYSVVPLRIDRLEIQAVLDPEWVASILDPPEPSQSLPGLYEAGQMKVTVESAEGQLKMTIPGQNPYPLKKLDGMKYELEGGKGWTAEFTVEAGRARSVTLTPPPGTGQPATLNRVEK
ncbi:MAG TPA: tetratricopeptide repeat protein, partial [Planctomycetota bacterium]|nr:tetratricopeptide repeat protein [Planctomycetota bacterium]